MLLQEIIADEAFKYDQVKHLFNKFNFSCEWITYIDNNEAMREARGCGLGNISLRISGCSQTWKNPPEPLREDDKQEKQLI